MTCPQAYSNINSVMKMYCFSKGVPYGEEYHAMAMCLEKDKKSHMTMKEEHGDKWLKDYNQIVSLYQAYHN